MKRTILSVLAIIMVAMIALPANAASNELKERLLGYFVLSVEEHGELYFVNPDSSEVLYVANPAQTWQLIKGNMTGITDADLAKLPTSKNQDVSTTGKQLVERFTGKFLLAVESSGEVWYVSPQDSLRHYLGTGEATFDKVKFLALGASKNDVSILTSQKSIVTDNSGLDINDYIKQVSKTDADQYPYLLVDSIQASLDQINYYDSQMGWEFASTLWSAYEQYNRDFQNYTEIKWFESGFKFNLPIYFAQNGFTLEPEGEVYFRWDNLSLEFFKMFYSNFEMITPGNGTATMKVVLPRGLETPQYGALPAGTYYFTSTHGFLTQEKFNNLDQITTNNVVVDQDQYIANIKSNLSSYTYTDAVMGWEFANSLWLAYESYNGAFQNYPEIKWFESGLKYNLPIYFNESGFTLDKDVNAYWSWNKFSPEFYKMYFENFSMTTPGSGTATMKIVLPEAVSTEKHGILEAGTYYFISRQGLITAEQFGKTDEGRLTVDLKDVDLNKEAQRVVDTVFAVRDAVQQFRNYRGFYPVVTDRPLVLGENGITKISRDGAFWDNGIKSPVLLDNIQSGAPTTEITYDSMFNGDGYSIAYTLLGHSDKYESGVYQATPHGIKRIGPVPKM